MGFDLSSAVPAGENDRSGLKTDLPAQSMAYTLMVKGSLLLGTLLLTEQYFGRRIDCFSTGLVFSHPVKTIGEYCWQHGKFGRNDSTSSSSIVQFPVPIDGLLLQSYVYYFLRGVVFLLPHMIWETNYADLIETIIKNKEANVKELKELWKKYEEEADPDFRDLQAIASARVPSKEPTNQKLSKTSTKAIMTLTRDVVQITKRMMPRYIGTARFVKFRIAYDLTFSILFLLFDLTLFTAAYSFDSTDYYCELPTNEIVRCMVPVMRFQFHVAILALAASFLVSVICLIQGITMLASVCEQSTSKCFLERIPYASKVGDLHWKKDRNRSTYIIVSNYILQNFTVLYPLIYMEAFVKNAMVKREKMMNSEELKEIQDAADELGKEGDGGEEDEEDEQM